ncbi:helix-turn-helix domain-containing protein [Paenibacillus sp. N4]|nr:helix-turn-helix domain-containing protein [Paenibacillus vietnamensis]
MRYYEDRPQLATGLKSLAGTAAKVLDFIVTHDREKGFPPTVREIGEAVGLTSSSSVHGHLARLEKYGYIKRNGGGPGSPRAIQVIGKREGGTDAVHRN